MSETPRYQNGISETMDRKATSFNGLFPQIPASQLPPSIKTKPATNILLSGSGMQQASSATSTSAGGTTQNILLASTLNANTPALITDPAQLNTNKVQLINNAKILNTSTNRNYDEYTTQPLSVVLKPDEKAKNADITDVMSFATSTPQNSPHSNKNTQNGNFPPPTIFKNGSNDQSVNKQQSNNEPHKSSAEHTKFTPQTFFSQPHQDFQDLTVKNNNQGFRPAPINIKPQVAAPAPASSGSDFHNIKSQGFTPSVPNHPPGISLVETPASTGLISQHTNVPPITARSTGHPISSATPTAPLTSVNKSQTLAGTSVVSSSNKPGLYANSGPSQVFAPPVASFTAPPSSSSGGSSILPPLPPTSGYSIQAQGFPQTSQGFPPRPTPPTSTSHRRYPQPLGHDTAPQSGFPLQSSNAAGYTLQPGYPPQQMQPPPNQFQPHLARPNQPPLPPTSHSQMVPGYAPTPANTHSQMAPGYPSQPTAPGYPPISQPSNQYQHHHQQQQPMTNLNQQFGNLNITQTGFNRLWGMENTDLLQMRNILPPEKLEPPPIRLQMEALDAANCHPDIFRCTMTKIPENSSLLNKSRLPLGVLIHPFRDLNHLPVIQCSTIVRCRACRTYINPFVYFVDQKRWKCNLCYRVNELPEEFQYDPVSKSYGDPSRRPEIKTSTIEYIAPSEYMLRPPQPAVYLFLLDVSSLAIESGYLQILCNTLSEELDNLPGDARTHVGFLCYNSGLHFYSLADGLSQPHQMTVLDIDDVFLPSPDGLLINLKERKELVRDLLAQLPSRFLNTHDNNSALGAALQAALKMMSPTGGRVSVFQCTLPVIGPGALTPREVPANRANTDVQHLNPATDFYKRLALDCSAHQVAVDLFILNSQYVDLSTISGISRFSAGCIHHWPLFKASRQPLQAQQFENCLRRYLTRKIGYEAVMRIRCTRGLSIHTFHGNFFVRSTDLLSLPNCNPDAGFGMQVAIEESLSDLQTVCFQAALLYTSSKGERRIRVHTLCLPIANTLSDVLNSADQQCIVGLVAKMAVDRSFQSSLSDARDAFINVVVDVLSAYKLSLNQATGSGSTELFAPGSLKLLPLYIIALLKYVAFKTGTNTRLDDRVFAMCQMKSLPLTQLLQDIYPDLYPLHQLPQAPSVQTTEGGQAVPQLPRLHLSAEKLESRGVFLLDQGQHMMIYVGHAVSPDILNNVLGFPHYTAIPDDCYELPKTGTPDNERLHLFVANLNDEKPYAATIQIIRDNSPMKKLFLEKLIEDRIETALSYYEFLQHLKTHVK